MLFRSSGFGQQSDRSLLGSHDVNYMALSGVLAQLVDKSGRPVHPKVTFADFIGGMAAAERILAALSLSQIHTAAGLLCCSTLAFGVDSVTYNDMRMHAHLTN